VKNHGIAGVDPYSSIVWERLPKVILNVKCPISPASNDRNTSVIWGIRIPIGTIAGYQHW
jgi:hypothetical protein